MIDMGDTGVIGFDDFVEFAEGGMATGHSDDAGDDSESDGGRRGTSRKKRRRAGGAVDDDVDDLADELRHLVQKAKKRGVDYRTSFEARHAFAGHFSVWVPHTANHRGISSAVPGCSS